MMVLGSQVRCRVLGLGFDAGEDGKGRWVVDDFSKTGEDNDDGNDDYDEGLGFMK